MSWPELAGRRVGIWGMGREGRAALRLLAGEPGTELVLFDDDPPADLGRPVLTGADGVAALRTADVVLKSPGISRYDERVTALTDAGVLVTSGAGIWMQRYAAQTIGVTGSKGKSTTASLIHHVLHSLGVDSRLAGNIGVPLLDVDPAGVDRFVVELSSYQCSDLRTSPDVAVVTALFPEHLNWHGSVQRYFADKLNIVRHGPRAVVYNASDETLSRELRPADLDAWVIAAGAPDGPHVDGDAYLFGGETLFGTDVTALRGRHNRTNVCIALGAVRAVGIDCVAARREIAEALASFEALPHRLTLIEDAASGITFVDDSLSTAPQATVAALEAFDVEPICVLVGGQDRGVDYRPLAEYLRRAGRAVTVIGLPESGPRILREVEGVPGVTVLPAADLHDAVRLCRRTLPAGGYALLSPGAPSYGRFRDYADRSAHFRAAIDETAPAS
jgi:UDP-N-acetylmuramoylalanine--D-glutamate ligase